MVSDASLSALAEIEADGTQDAQYMAILRRLATKGPGTCREIAEDVLSNHTVSKRRSFLTTSGMVRQLPQRKCDVTGRLARPIIITDAGRKVLAGAPLPKRARETESQRARNKRLLALLNVAVAQDEGSLQRRDAEARLFAAAEESLAVSA